MTKKNILFLIVIILILLAILWLLWDLFRSPKPKEVLSPKMQEIKSRGEIIIGTNAAFPPMESFDEQGNLVGIDIEIAKRIAQNLGVRPKFQQVEWQDIFDSLLADNVDMIISGITILPERTQIMAFSNPYFNAGQVIVINDKDSENITEPSDLTGKILGAQQDTTGYAAAEKLSDKVIGYTDYSEAKEALLRQEIDAIVVDYPVAISLVGSGDNIIIVGEPFTQEFYGIAVKKENKQLLDKINESLVELKKSGELDQIIAYWKAQ